MINNNSYTGFRTIYKHMLIPIYVIYSSDLTEPKCFKTRH